jgi:small neutral amino acid transporter SnatA (MarC family)
MNRKVITVIAVIVVAALCVLAMMYAPNIMEFMLRLHQGIPRPQH